MVLYFKKESAGETYTEIMELHIMFVLDLMGEANAIALSSLHKAFTLHYFVKDRLE